METDPEAERIINWEVEHVINWVDWKKVKAAMKAEENAEVDVSNLIPIARRVLKKAKKTKKLCSSHGFSAAIVDGSLMLFKNIMFSS